jgi:hypothetical protein
MNRLIVFRRLSTLLKSLINETELKIIKLPPSNKYWAIFLKNLQQYHINNIIVEVKEQNLNTFMIKVNLKTIS